MRKNAILRCNMRRESIEKTTSSQQRSDELFYEFPDSAYDLLKQLLEMDCDKRITAQEALKHPFFHPPTTTTITSTNAIAQQDDANDQMTTAHE